LDFYNASGGWLEVICGPMFSGKSEELIRRLRRASIARKRVQAFKPALDNRYSETDIVTHADLRMSSTPVVTAAEILQYLDAGTEVIGIDESNFFGPSLTAIADELADSGRRVIVAGLDTDFLGRPFPPMPDLLAIAESITKTLAICMCCGNPAKHSQRLSSAKDLILVGAEDVYEARCRNCFRPALAGGSEPSVSRSHVDETGSKGHTSS
jgi:thymidine kinase